MIDTLIEQLTQTIADKPLLVLGSVIATGFVIVIALLLRPRKPVADPAAEQRHHGDERQSSDAWGSCWRPPSRSFSRR